VETFSVLFTSKNLQGIVFMEATARNRWVIAFAAGDLPGAAYRQTLRRTKTTRASPTAAPRRKTISSRPTRVWPRNGAVGMLGALLSRWARFGVRVLATDDRAGLVQACGWLEGFVFTEPLADLLHAICKRSRMTAPNPVFPDSQKVKNVARVMATPTGPELGAGNSGVQ